MSPPLPNATVSRSSISIALLDACFMLVSYVTYSSVMKLEATCPSETDLIDIFVSQKTLHGCENLISFKKK
jgi:hypothetical protein